MSYLLRIFSTVLNYKSYVYTWIYGRSETRKFHLFIFITEQRYHYFVIVNTSVHTI